MARTAPSHGANKGSIPLSSAMKVEEIANYIFLEDSNPKGDIAFVFGTMLAWEGSVKKAVELYRSGAISKIIVSGGKNPKSGIIEGDWMKGKIVELGVPSGDILNENTSTNSLENVLFAKALLEKEIGLQNIKTIVAVVKNYHSRRAVMTLKKHFPSHTIFRVAPYYSEYYGFTKENWQESEFGKEKVAEEIEKIKKYLAKGDIQEL